jgi:hypothetical protein
MEIKTKRFLLFLLGCIPMRLFFVYLVKHIAVKYLPYLGVLGLIVGISFLWLYAFGNKAADGQLAWAGEPYIWWNSLRIVHGLLYLGFAATAFTKQRDYAAGFLLTDVTVGLVAWLIHHFN